MRDNSIKTGIILNVAAPKVVANLQLVLDYRNINIIKEEKILMNLLLRP